MTASKLACLALTGLLLLALLACAGQPEHHTFSFGGFSGKENQGIKILNYRYGDDITAPTRPADWQLASGHIPQRMAMGTFAPPGDSLYVKWQVISTGKIYEDTVDLKKRLPRHIDGKIIYFSIQGPNLSVYVIEGYNYFHTSKEPDCSAEAYRLYQCTRIYPDHWSNF